MHLNTFDKEKWKNLHAEGKIKSKRWESSSCTRMDQPLLRSKLNNTAKILCYNLFKAHDTKER